MQQLEKAVEQVKADHLAVVEHDRAMTEQHHPHHHRPAHHLELAPAPPPKAQP